MRLKMRKRKHGAPDRDAKSTLAEKTKRAISGVLLTVTGVFFTLAGFGAAGSLGESLYESLSYLFGAGYALVPLATFTTAAAIVTEKKTRMQKWKWFGGVLTFFSLLGLLEVMAPGYGGVVGNTLALPLLGAVATPTTVELLAGLSLVGLMLIFDTHMLVPTWFTRAPDDTEEAGELKIAGGKPESTKEDVLDTRPHTAPEPGSD